jgi:hypothetical protein
MAERWMVAGSMVGRLGKWLPESPSTVQDLIFWLLLDIVDKTAYSQNNAFTRYGQYNEYLN